jgi:hypothetical protein
MGVDVFISAPSGLGKSIGLKKRLTRLPRQEERSELRKSFTTLNLLTATMYRAVLPLLFLP